MSLEPGIVCGECDLLNPVGQGECSGCGNNLSLSRADSQESEPAQPLSDSEQPVEETEAPPAVAASGEEEEPMQQAQHYVCKSCYSPVPSGHKFCGKCGTPLAASVATGDPEYFGEMQVPGKAKLILIKGEGMDGVSYHLNSTEHMAGRTEGAILFGDDQWLSPRHANFFEAAPHATAQDLFDLISDVRLRVEVATGVMLEPEIRFIGEFDEQSGRRGLWPAEIEEGEEAAERIGEDDTT